MSISVTCPNCTSTLKAPDDLAGRRARCAKCGLKLTIPGPPRSQSDTFDFASDDSLPVASASTGRK